MPFSQYLSVKTTRSNLFSADKDSSIPSQSYLQGYVNSSALYCRLTHRDGDHLSFPQSITLVHILSLPSQTQSARACAVVPPSEEELSLMSVSSHRPPSFSYRPSALKAQLLVWTRWVKQGHEAVACFERIPKCLKARRPGVDPTEQCSSLGYLQPSP